MLASARPCEAGPVSPVRPREAVGRSAGATRKLRPVTRRYGIACRGPKNEVWILGPQTPGSGRRATREDVPAVCGVREHAPDGSLG